jgi:hypothetical protein
MAKKRKAKSPSSRVDPAVGASTSTTTPGPSRDGMTAGDVLRSMNTFLEILKTINDTAQMLVSLEAVCCVLRIAVDTAKVRSYIQYRATLMTIEWQLLHSNGEDLADLIEKLEPQQRLIESEIATLSKPEFSKSQHVQDLVEPLWRYLLFVYTLLEMHSLTRKTGH